MTLSRFSLAFRVGCLIALLPALAIASTPSVQDANQAFRQGNNQAALEKVNSFLTANPKDAQGRFLKGLILTELNRYPDAIKVFSGLTEDFPELPEPYNNLAVLYAAQADYERAKNSLEMAIRTHPSYATAHENLGDIYAKMASQAYDKALQLDKSNTSAQTKLALIRDLFSPTPRPQEPTKLADAGKGKAKPASKSPAKPATPAQEAPPAEETKPATARETVEPATPAKEAAKPVPEVIDPKAQIERTLRAWSEAWSARDAEAYLAFYSSQFKVPAGTDFATWSQERKTRITRPEFIKVSIDRLKIKLKGDSAQVSFTQRYESNIVKDSGKKTVVLVREGSTWKIVEER
jgi:tetratricopeptide (TPR) repeat protein